MINFLALIYIDRYEVLNAHTDFKKLIMQPMYTFNEFYTQFLYLVSIGKISQEDYYTKLYNKLIINL